MNTESWSAALLAAVTLLAAAACSAAGPGDDASPGTTAAHKGKGGSAGAGGSNLIHTGGKGGSGGSKKADNGNSCESTDMASDVETVVRPGNVLIIFDRSDSMAENFDTPQGCAPKYSAAGTALLDAVSPIADQLVVGSLFFPTSSKLAICSAQVDPITAGTQIDFRSGVDFVEAWNAWWQQNKLILGTPLNRAFDRADEALANAGLEGNTAVVVFTDGEPVCTDGMPAPQRAASWLSQGIKTYVVGLPGAESSTLLNDIAVKGGTGGFLLPKDSAALTQELAKIAETTISTTIKSCTVNLNPAPANPNDVHLVVTEASSQSEYEVPRDTGWKLSANGSTATLLGETCEDAKSGRFSSVRFEYGCVELPPLPK